MTEVRITMCAAEAHALAGSTPFRAPHYTVSCDGMLGEFERADGGVLYLAELGEFRPGVIDWLAELLKMLDDDPRPRLIALDFSVGALTGRALEQYLRRMAAAASAIITAAAWGAWAAAREAQAVEEAWDAKVASDELAVADMLDGIEGERERAEEVQS